MNEPSDRARELLHRYRGSIGPSDAERESLVRAVIARVDAGGAAPARGSASGSGTPWLVVIGVVALVGAAAWWSARAPAVARPLPAFAGMPGSLVEPAAPPLAVGAPAIHERPASAVVPAIVVADPVTEPSTPPRSAATRPRTRARAEPTASAPIEPPPTLVDEEVRLLREANLALKDGDDARARALFDEHARRFPVGELLELREVGRALLRCRGDAELATATIDAFASRFPGSPHLARLARECPRKDR